MPSGAVAHHAPQRDLEFAGIDDGQQELDEEIVDDNDDSLSSHSDEGTFPLFVSCAAP
jgi:hypothetical protein